MQSKWDDEQIIFDGDEYFSELIRAIEQAAVSIDLETYIFQADSLGRKMEASLTQAAQRGVKVRLLVDGVGASGWIEKRSPTLGTSGVQLRIFHPVHKASAFLRYVWTHSFRRRTPESRRYFWKVNRRTHRKLCIIDGKTAWVGSLNISSTHCKSHAGPGAWRDTAARVRGEPVRDLIFGFEHAWSRSHTPEGKRRWTESWSKKLSGRSKLQSPLVRMNYTARMRRRNMREFLIRLQTARRRIWITTPYLAPTPVVIRALTRAAQNGADVRILHPRKSDVFFMPWVASVYYRPLLKAGVRIFEYLPRFLHAKSAIIDDWSIVGTSNMNRRSWVHDLEVDVVLTHDHSRHELEEEFQADLRSSEEIHSPAQGLTGWLGRLFTYLLKDWI